MLEYILGICPYKTNFADLSHGLGAKSDTVKAKEKLWFSNGFSGYRKRSVI